VDHNSAHCPHVRFRLTGNEYSLHSRHLSAQAAITPDESKIVVSNLYDGFDVYSLNDRKHIRTLPIYIMENVSLPVTFVHDCKTVLLGSSQGTVRLVDISTGDILHILRHDSKVSCQVIVYYGSCLLDWDIVQALSYHHQVGDSVHYIATATSEKGNATYVKIWKDGSQNGRRL
jgi:WD40 repeat protein